MAKPSTTVYVKHADLPDTDIRHLPLSLCEAANTLIPDNVIGAQLINGIWAIWLKTTEIHNNNISFHYNSEYSKITNSVICTI